MAPNGSQWLPMAPNDSHRVSLLLNHYPKIMTICILFAEQMKRFFETNQVSRRPKVNI